MQITQLCHRLAKLLALSNEATDRTIIHFRSKGQYQQFVKLWHSELSADYGQGKLDWLPAASAIRIHLDDKKLLEPNLDLFSIESDQQLRIDAKFYLPHTSKTALSFDPAQKVPWGVVATRAPKLWNKSKGNRIRIGVVDTGADYSHPDIRPSLMKGINIIHPQLSASDDNGHGTHIAGTIAASCARKSAVGIRGVAPKSDLFPVKAFDHEGSAYVSDIILAIQWCIANHMDIINMSFGMTEYSPSLYQAVKSAYTHNVVIVASSGNNGKSNAVDYPAKMPYTIAVGALNKRGQIAAFSNRGKEVDIYAPGEAIYSTWPGNRYNELNGTSMAAAHVSGVIALLLARKPRLTYNRIKRAITASAFPISTGTKQKSRPGRLDAVRAWVNLQQKPCKKTPIIRVTKPIRPKKAHT